jgi:transposase-like protein
MNEKHCPACGNVMQYDYQESLAVAHWVCPACGEVLRCETEADRQRDNAPPADSPTRVGRDRMFR